MQRLKSRAQFQAVLAGTTVAKSGHFVLHRLELPVDSLQASSSRNELPTTAPQTNASAAFVQRIAGQGSPALFDSSNNWLGAMVPKRWAKRAVTRNMIKRRIYSLAISTHRPNTAKGENVAYVVRLRSAFDPRLYKSATSAPLRLAISQELTGLFAQGFGRG